MSENASDGTTVGLTALAIDADATNNTITYSLDDNAGGRFAIDANTGVVTVADRSLLDYDTIPSHNITICASSIDGSTATQVMTIQLTNANEGPSAVVDTATAVEAGGVANRLVGIDPTGNVLTNDTDLDSGDTKTVTGVRFGGVANASGAVGNAVLGNYGSIVINADGSYQYTVDNVNTVVQSLRDSSDTLTEVFTYTMRDGLGLTSTSQISVVILGVNDAPTQIGRSYSTSYIDTLSVTTDGVLTGATDSELDAITARLLTIPLLGTLVFNIDGTFTYHPEIEFIGHVTFVYQAYDGKTYSDPITVTIDVSLPRALPGSGLSGSGVSSDSGSTSGSGSSSSGGASNEDGAVAALIPVGVSIQIVPTQNAPAVEPESLQGLGQVTAREVVGIGLVESRESHRIGEVGVGLSQRTMRRYEGEWIAGQSSEERERMRSREEFAMSNSIMSGEKKEREDGDDQSPISLAMGTVVTTVLGTGVILWVVQATQLAATFITATAPTWMHIDIASTLDNLAKEKNASDEASAKIFER